MMHHASPQKSDGGSPTKRALDAGESARFLAFFAASAFFSSNGVPPPAPAQVTRAVSRHNNICPQID
jgi:hypothetical protein